MAEVTVTEISHQHISEALANRVNRLLTQLTPRANRVDAAYLKTVISQADVYIYGALQDGELTGVVICVIASTLLRKTMYLEEMVVDEAHRGKGIGGLLLEKAIEKAKEVGAKELDLTSNQSRTSAIALYESYGFTKRDTNAYRLIFGETPNID